jgi:glycosyltransferase involved in cell wall biosynthesis
MRILLASDHYPPFIGGAHRQTRLLASGMARRGHDVTVVTPWHGDLPTVEKDDGVVVHRIKQLRTALPALARDRRQRHQPPFPDPVTIWGLRRVIAATRPDVINVHGWFAFSVAAALGRRRIPLLVSARDYGYFCATRTLVQKGAPCDGPAPLKCLACAGSYYGAPKGWVTAAGVAMCRPLLVRKMTGLHSISSYVNEVTRRFLLGPGNPHMHGRFIEVTIPDFLAVDAPGVAGTDNPEVAAQLALLPNEPFILFVGAFRKVKGLETLFAAYRRLSSAPPLVLIGTFERDSPRDFPREAIVLTDVPHVAVMAAWDRAMFGVMPSLLPEPLGSAVAEAMSRGKPVIGTQLGGHVDMVDETNGILVPQGDAASLAQAMEELIRDPKRREAYGRAAAQRARTFAAPAVLPRMEQAYRDVIAAAEIEPMQDTTRDRLRILMVAPRSPLAQGGVERHVMEVSRRVVAAGADVEVLCAEPGGRAVSTVRRDGVLIRSVRAWPAKRDYYLAPRIWREVAREPWDLIHVQSYHTLVAPLAMLRALTLGVPYVVTFHGGGHSSRVRNRLRRAQRRALRPLLARAERLVATARFEIDLYGRELGLPREKFVLIPNGADLTAIDRSASERPGEPGLLASIGRLERYKGHHRVIAALPHVLEQQPDARLLVVGTGPYEAALHRQAAELGVDHRVEFTSVAAEDRSGMSALLQRVSLVVLLSDFETHPMVALEALAVGRPLLVADRGGLGELAADGLARAVPPDEIPRAVGHAILEELARPQQRGAPQLTSWDECVSRLLELYGSLALTRSHAKSLL